VDNAALTFGSRCYAVLVLNFLRTIGWLRALLIGIVIAAINSIAGLFFLAPFISFSLGVAPIVLVFPYLLFLGVLLLIVFISSLVHYQKNKSASKPDVTRWPRTIVAGVLLGIFVIPLGSIVTEVIYPTDRAVEQAIARDADRGCTDAEYDSILISDVAQIRLGLELYRDQFGSYPRELSELYEQGFMTEGGALCGDVRSGDYRRYYYDATPGGYELGANLIGVSTARYNSMNSLQGDIDVVVPGGKLTNGSDTAGCAGETGFRCYVLTHESR